MNTTITGREELLLAKIAGNDVDISTMTPPVAMNKREALLLDIADRIDNIEDGGGSGGSGDSGVMIVTLTEHDGSPWTADVNAADIITAFEAKIPIFIFADGERGSLFPVVKADAEMIFAGATGIIRDGTSYFMQYGTAIYSDGAWIVDGGDPVPVADCTPFEITGTIGESEDKTTMGLGVSASTLYTAAASGRMFCITADIDEDVSLQCVVKIDAYRFTSDGSANYTFRFINNEGTAFSAVGLSASDTVVLIEE